MAAGLGGYALFRLGKAATGGAFAWDNAGRCQKEGGEIEEIRPGDRVFFEPGENHWHGAAADRFMVHVALQEADESGSPETWGRHVTDEEYGAAASGARG